MKNKRLIAIAATVLFVHCHQLDAHFVWLRLDAHGDHGQAKLFFSESGSVDGDKLPESIAKANVSFRTPTRDGDQIELTPMESDDEVGLKADIEMDAHRAACLETSCQYGMYHGSLLHYFAKAVYLVGDQAAAIASAKDHRLDLAPMMSDEGLQITVTWDGAPYAEAEVSVELPNEETEEFTTDDAGSFTIADAAPGLYSLRANRTDEDASGSIDGEDFKQTSYYSTLTVSIPRQAAAHDAAAPASNEQSSFATLPEGIASFGAAVADGWLYVYSGHTGKAHDHSIDNLSKSFRRLNLSNGADWETLPMQTPLQGMPLVSFDGKLYRIGGLNAKNKPDEDEHLVSVDECARFDPQTKTWEALPALPAGRSSHDAVVVDGKLFVVGGWQLSGDSDGTWHESSLVMDLTSDHPAWKEFSTPFTRRALAAGHCDGKVYVIGGMDDFNEVQRIVNVYDPATGNWTDGPELPGEGMEGFGVSAWNLDSHLYVSGPGGALFRLNDSREAWEKVASVESRFFHRLLPLGEELIAVGGASRRGHLTNIEKLSAMTAELH